MTSPSQCPFQTSSSSLIIGSSAHVTINEAETAITNIYNENVQQLETLHNTLQKPSEALESDKTIFFGRCVLGATLGALSGYTIATAIARSGKLSSAEIETLYSGLIGFSSLVGGMCPPFLLNMSFEEETNSPNPIPDRFFHVGNWI